MADAIGYSNLAAAAAASPHAGAGSDSLRRAT